MRCAKVLAICFTLSLSRLLSGQTAGVGTASGDTPPG